MTTPSPAANGILAATADNCTLLAVTGAATFKLAPAFKQAAQAVKYFRRYAHKGKINIRLNTVVGRYNYLSLPPLAP